ncbi:hypothetical protein SAMN05216222_5604 [Pseudomonas prosekii]|uniref:Uncharacterized protein n=1 Tax=Pseudomonas prosekii TaxID=1148509 RepID=A0A1H2BXU8_9PSED|nr:hypothetical protein SAMN05216222_5604 [Pseudomonas prosekii]
MCSSIVSAPPIPRPTLLLWRGGSPPSGCAAAPSLLQPNSISRFDDCCAAERGQAPSPRGVRLAGVFAPHRNGMHRPHQFRAQHKPLVARGLAPVGLRSGPSLLQPRSISRFDDCCAAERGQAPSPRGVRLAGVFAPHRNGMHRSHQLRAQHKPLVARGLAPVGLRSGPSLLQPHSISRFDDCCAAERGQAPSPRGVWLAGVFAPHRNGMHRSHQFRAQRKPLVARGLAPVGLRSGPSLLQPNSISRFDDCCAAERGQAPSPRGWCETGRCFRTASERHASVPPIPRPTQLLWRGGSPPSGCAAAPAYFSHRASAGLTTAAQPNGGKPPRHGVCGWQVFSHRIGTTCIGPTNSAPNTNPSPQGWCELLVIKSGLAATSGIGRRPVGSFRR